MMKFSTERAHFFRALHHVHRVVERRNTIPILSNILLRCEDNLLYIKATDLDIEVTENIPAMVEQSGATTIPAHMIYDIIRKLPDGADIVIESDDDSSVSVASGRSKFQIQALPDSDFPNIAAGELPHQFSLPAQTLLQLFNRTQFAISTEETRYYLNGIYLHIIQDDGNAAQLCAVATDGHRLAKTHCPAPQGSHDMPGIIVPRKAVSEIQRLISDFDDDIAIELSDAKIKFSFGDITFTSKLIDGTFPDYERVIPKSNDKKLIIEKDPFSSAVDRVSTVASERGRGVKMSLSPDQLKLSVSNPDSGSANEELSANYQNDDLDIGFNARYLLDISNQITSGELQFYFNDHNAPCLIYDGDNRVTLFVLMPMRV
jgi:DNA polymerase-3 subunit beta